MHYCFILESSNLYVIDLISNGVTMGEQLKICLHHLWDSKYSEVSLQDQHSTFCLVWLNIFAPENGVSYVSRNVSELLTAETASHLRGECSSYLSNKKISVCRNQYFPWSSLHFKQTWQLFKCIPTSLMVSSFVCARVAACRTRAAACPSCSVPAWAAFGLVGPLPACRARRGQASCNSSAPAW